MERSSYLRLALMFGENKASTFNKNLEKMIALVLFAIGHLVTISVCLISDGMLLAVLCMGVYKYILKRG